MDKKPSPWKIIYLDSVSFYAVVFATTLPLWVILRMNENVSFMQAVAIITLPVLGLAWHSIRGRRPEKATSPEGHSVLAWGSPLPAGIMDLSFFYVLVGMMVSLGVIFKKIGAP